MQLVFATGFLVPQMLLGQEYYRGVKAIHPDALFPTVPAIGDIASRGEALARAIHNRFPSGPVHVIAHSMAGLDTRYALQQNLYGIADPGRVAVLSTIATPHHGSAIADLVLGPAGNPLDPRQIVFELARHTLQALTLPEGAIYDLTLARAAAFNAGCPNVPHVRYVCYTGAGIESFLLRSNHLYLSSIGKTPEDKANDGLVTVASASWTPLAEAPWPTDHIGEVGHCLDTPPRFASSFDHLSAIARVIRNGELAAAAAAGV